MSYGSDNTKRPMERPFAIRGIGATLRFRCGKCDQPRDVLGSGFRKVWGLRTKICTACKDEIDARRAKA
jgi:hypothetical protein